ncbi:hypothetical protein SCP_0502660 [Sparassis crispa]|uniref:Rho termination factor N-terminal domain-containing protein n=1 Tax=Sparassis crispa TaxID=139825 RepID=A0A401GM38_9APHY|nr:hypothetical protein SCP_0502660 [Sparassis crispa]GBE83219.1 hypothetical protein SCP_0502660 [Sparassis crispa]
MADSTAMSLQKLTVPQLKAICKERNITGYSKLGKSVLIQKLTDSGYVSNTAAGGAAIPRPVAESPSTNAQITPLAGTSNFTATGNSPATASLASAAKDTQLARKKKTKPRKQNPKDGPPSAYSSTAPVPLISTSSLSTSDSGHGITTALPSHGPASTTADSPLRIASCVPALSVRSSATAQDTPVLLSGSEQSLEKDSQLSLQPEILPISQGQKERSVISSSSTSCASSAASASDASLRLPNSKTGTKRLQDTSLAPSKRQKLQHTVTASKPISVLPIHPSSTTFKVPGLPAPRSPLSSAPVQSPAIISFQDAIPTTPRAAPCGRVRILDEQPVPPSIVSANRFKPLIVSRPPAKDTAPQPPPAVLSDHSVDGLTQHITDVQADQRHIRSVFCYLDFPRAAAVPSLVPITLPPSLSQRKRVHRWAIILSGLSNEERRRCVLVSRMFRYASEFLPLSSFCGI